MGLSWAGIDNGTSGAVAILREDGSHYLQKMPVNAVGDKEFIDESALFLLLQSEGKPFTVFEQGQKNPKFGVNNFTSGFSFGVVQTVLRLLKCPHRCVNPKTWQTPVFKDIRGAAGDTKGVAIEFCRRNFPHINLIPPRCHKPHDGLADALCMAWWSRQEAFKQ